MHRKVGRRPRSSPGQGLESTVSSCHAHRWLSHDTGLELGLLTAHCWAPLALGERVALTAWV